MDASVEVLLHRLRGLCDNADTGPETFHDQEMCFSIREFLAQVRLWIGVKCLLRIDLS